MAKIFDRVKVERPKYNKFDLSHERKMSMQMGKLVPIMVQEVLPGDSFRVSSEIFVRFAPMLAPMMHRVNVFTHCFHVPNRLVWDEWEDFITGGAEGVSNPVHPYIQINSTNVGLGLYDQGSLWDYMGLPNFESVGSVTNPVNVSALPFRAYQLIYNEYYRDQNLQQPVDVQTTSGQVVDTNQIDALLTLRQRAWEKDYFTSALPWAQRGAEVLMPVEGVAEAADITYKDPTEVFEGNSFSSKDTQLWNQEGVLSDASEPSATRYNLRNIEEVRVQNTSITMNVFRRAAALQKWLEKMARGGARYIEQMLVMFGVVSSDARQQRPEYLGGGKQPVVVSEVLQTSQTEATGTAQGNMSGHGVSVGNQNGFKRRFEEHGFVIVIMSILPKTAYQQGISRMFRRFDRFDYYWRDFAHLGEQEVKVGELWYDPEGAAGEVDQTFGYQSRYCEYKYVESSVHGVFRTNLAYWHMGRIFSAKPVLNESFVMSDPTDRIFAVQDAGNETIYCQIYNRVDALRPIPYFSTPGLSTI